MTITSSEKIEDTAQADSSRHVAFRFAFHTGLIITKRMLRPSGWDDTAGLIEMAVQVEQEVIDNEDSNLIALAEDAKIDPVTETPVHPETETATNRRKRFHRKLLRYAMKHRDVKKVRNLLYGIWYELKFNLSYNLSQLATYFDISIGQASNMNSRIQEYHDNLTMIDTDDTFMEDIE